MEHGAIVEQGNHDELLAAGGAYARLYQSQFEAAIAEVS
jgi:ATP-binding cassette subfamily B protein